MELKEYIKVIKREHKLVIAIATIVAMSAFLFSSLRPVKYETSLLLTIAKNRTQPTDEFKYDDYYALQSSDIISSSIEQWLKNPAVVNSIYQKANIEAGFRSIKNYAKKFNAKKMSSQLVEIKFESKEKEEAEKISTAIVETINDKVLELKKNSEEEISFEIKSEKPITMKSDPDEFLNLFIGLVSGFILGIFIVFFKRYFHG